MTGAQVIVLATPVFLLAHRAGVRRRRGARAQHLPAERHAEQHRPGRDEPGHRAFGTLFQVAMYTLGVPARGAVRAVGRSSLWVWIVALLGYDFCYYWLHRAGHRVARAVGSARGAPPERGLQPQHGAAPDQQRLPARLDLLPAAGRGRRAAAGLRRGGADRPALPVLGAHAAGRQAGLVRPLVLQPQQPPRAPCRERPLPGQELRRHPDRLGPPVRHLRRGRRRRALRLRHARAAAQLEPAVGQPAGLPRPVAGQLARALLGRQAARVAQAAGLAAGRRGRALAEAGLRHRGRAALRPAAERRAPRRRPRRCSWPCSAAPAPSCGTRTG